MQTLGSNDAADRQQKGAGVEGEPSQESVDGGGGDGVAEPQRELPGCQG